MFYNATEPKGMPKTLTTCTREFFPSILVEIRLFPKKIELIEHKDIRYYHYIWLRGIDKFMVLPYYFGMEINDQYLSAEAIAETLNISAQHVRSLARRGKIPAERFGKTWLISRDILNDKKFLFSILPDVKDQKNTQDFNGKAIKGLSFFSGAMGLDIGLEKAGIEILLASEIEPTIRKTILLNKPSIGLIGDINNYSAKEIRTYAGLSEHETIDVITGGPPCQAFSTAGKRAGFNDTRGNVFLTFIDRILELQPRVAVIENVRGLLSAPLSHRPHQHRGFGYPPLTPEEEKGGALYHIINRLESGGYSVSFNLYNAANYGSPQKRERIVIFCIKGESSAAYIPPTHSENGAHGLHKWRTFEDVTKNLIEDDQEFLKFPELRLKYYRLLQPGQYWKHLPQELQKEAMGASYYAGGGKTGFLRRLAWDKPSPTLVTDPTLPATDLAHPVEDRPLSIQEYKRIQEFPDTWKFYGNIKEIYKQIGNAVPVSLGFAIGRHVKNLLTGSSILTIPDFQFSRYRNTDHVSFKLQMEKRRERIGSQKPLSMASSESIKSTSGLDDKSS